MRKKIVAGNWKMNTTDSSATDLAKGVVEGVENDESVGVILCPPFPYLSAVSEAIEGTMIELGAQNCYHEKAGAFTGEVSPQMLLDCGCQYVILGHSERRHVLGECGDLINRKVHCALECGLKVIICFGEKLEQREANQTEKVLAEQFSVSLANVSAESASQIILAYEPVWAIGTGHTATPEQAQAAHVFLREKAGELFGSEAAANMTIQYGGSVKPDNAASLFSQPDVDGGLIGGASLKAAQFLAIIEAARQS